MKASSESVMTLTCMSWTDEHWTSVGDMRTKFSSAITTYGARNGDIVCGLDITLTELRVGKVPRRTGSSLRMGRFSRCVNYPHYSIHSCLMLFIARRCLFR